MKAREVIANSKEWMGWILGGGNADLILAASSLPPRRAPGTGAGAGQGRGVAGGEGAGHGVARRI